MRKETSVVYTSKWTNGNHTCMVHSERKSGERFAKFWFTGWNPFPCVYMESTYTLISEWLTAAGYKKAIQERVSYTTDTIDSETGEIIDHTNVVYITKAIPETKETIPELLRQGNRCGAVRVYRYITGCTLKEAIDYVDAIKANLNL